MSPWMLVRAARLPSGQYGMAIERRRRRTLRWNRQDGYAPGTIILSRTGEPGRLTGSTKRCPTCNSGMTMTAARWPNGKLAWVCHRELRDLPDGQVEWW